MSEAVDLDQSRRRSGCDGRGHRDDRGRRRDRRRPGDRVGPARSVAPVRAGGGPGRRRRVRRPGRSPASRVRSAEPHGGGGQAQHAARVPRATAGHHRARRPGPPLPLRARRRTRRAASGCIAGDGVGQRRRGPRSGPARALCRDRLRQRVRRSDAQPQPALLLQDLCHARARGRPPRAPGRHSRSSGTRGAGAGPGIRTAGSSSPRARASTWIGFGVAARAHDDRWTVHLDGAAAQRGDADRARALEHQAVVFHGEAHGVPDGRLVHQHDLVDQVAHDWPRVGVVQRRCRPGGCRPTMPPRAGRRDGRRPAMPP